MGGFYNEPCLRALICGYSPSIVVAEDTGMAEGYMIGVSTRLLPIFSNDTEREMPVYLTEIHTDVFPSLV
jgi:hypothetical protein